MIPTFKQLAAFVVIAPSLLGATSSSAQSVSARRSASAGAATARKLETYMRTSTRLGQFSGSVLVSRDGHVLSSRGYGMADAEWSVPNTPSTKFRIGSVTKQFTAMAVLMLEERGAVQLTDPVCKYVADCPLAWKAITVHHLLTHTSGIPDFLGLADYETTKALPTTPQGLIDRFKGLPLDFVPGSKFEYSNSGYVLLGAIIEKASGKSYCDFLAANIFTPLKMSDTGCDSNAAVEPRRASGYTKPAGTLLNADPINMTVPYAAGALYSTTRDLLLWDHALSTDRLVSRKSMNAMFTPYKQMVGYGWAISSLFGRKMEHHDGGIDGFTSNIARFPDDQVLIVVLSNLEQAPVDAITKDLAAIVFGEKYSLPSARKIAKLDPVTLDAYIGKYAVTADIALTVSRQDDHLFASLSGGDEEHFEIFPESETRFFSTDPPVELVFARDAEGRMASVKINGEYTGKRVP
ncbi:MAG: serine hydrolase [Gemmatimonadaceae bacterium]